MANSNKVKDCFLFLFNHLLAIAKSVSHDYDALLEVNKPSPLDQKFIVKSIVQLRDVRFTADRDDPPLSSFASISQNPLVRTFVVQFAKCDEDMPMTLFPVILTLCLYYLLYCSLSYLSQSQYLRQLYTALDLCP